MCYWSHAQIEGSGPACLLIKALPSESVCAPDIPLLKTSSVLYREGGCLKRRAGGSVPLPLTHLLGDLESWIAPKVHRESL